MKNTFLAFTLFLMFSCSNTDDASYTNIPVTIDQPDYFPNKTIDNSSNPLTEKGVELGKKLFYDGRLSSDGIVSCGFCHIQEDAFTHHGHTFSHGVNEGVGTRNTPPLQNLAFMSTFMWDGVTPHLEMQPIIPLTSEIEMNANLNQVVAMMSADAEYILLYKQAFEDGKINTENMLKAMSQFMITMVSNNSKYDKIQRGDIGINYTTAEAAGAQIFEQKCASCHSGALQSNESFINNGLPVNPQIKDKGRFVVTNNPLDMYKFRVPSLRNIEKTAPYMHDGRFLTLNAVLNHYASGVQNSANLDPLLNQNNSLGIPLNESEKSQLIAFLKTLTDNDFLTNPRFSEF